METVLNESILKVPVICGPTSTGKTSLALKLCLKLNGEIISADSRQIYKYMDIGTGKLPLGTDMTVERTPNHFLLNGVKVWGYDLVQPGEYFSGVDFVIYALKKVRELASVGKTPFIVGGTGFYLDLLTGLRKPSNIVPDLELRTELEATTLPELQTKLMSLNPSKYKIIDLNNKVRLVRAIEIEMSQKINDTPLPYLPSNIFKFIGLTSDRPYLYQRADLWSEEIWKNGIVDEVKKLCDLGFSQTRPLKSFIYKTVNAYINGEILAADAVQRIKFDTHNYIRRQQTWFKRNTSIEWFDISHDDLLDKVYNSINLWTNKS